MQHKTITGGVLTGLLTVMLAACGQQAVVQPPITSKTLGYLQVQFQGTTSAQPTATARFIPAGQQAGISKQDLQNLSTSGLQIQSVYVGGFSVGTRGTPSGKRYLTGTFKVRNAATDGTPVDSDRTNLSLVAVDTPTTTDATAVASIRKFDGTAASSSLATQILPTQGLEYDPLSGLRVSGNKADLQVYTESELQTLTGLPAGETPLAYGYVVRNSVDGSRTLPATPADDQYDGLVTIGVEFPLQAQAKDDPYSFSMLFAVVENTQTQVAISPVDTYSDAFNRVNTHYGTAGYAYPVDVREYCQVRVAGNDPLNPTVDLVNPTLTTGHRDACWNSQVLGDGWAEIPNASGNVKDAVLQSDGKLVAATNTHLYRTHADGTQDTAFNTALQASATLWNIEVVRLHVLSNNRLLVAGYGYDGNTGTYRSFVEKYLADGTLDTSFGTNGVALLDYSAGDYTYVQDMNVQSDGKITLSGYVYPASGTVGHVKPFLSRLNVNGTEDAAFGAVRDITDGSTWTYGVQHVIRSNGQIVMAGNDFYYLDDLTYHMLVAFTPSGELDPTFSGDGFAGGNSSNGQIELLPDNTVLVYSNNAGDLQKFNVNGSRVSSFNLPGVSYAQVVGNQIYHLNGSSVTRYSATGVADTTFGTFNLSRFGTNLGNVRLNVASDGRLLTVTSQNAASLMGNTISITKIIP